MNEKELLKKLIGLKKTIQRKVMSMKRGVIDTEHTFNETFKPIIDPLNIIAKQNSGELCIQSLNDEVNENLPKITSLHIFSKYLLKIGYTKKYLAYILKKIFNN